MAYNFTATNSQFLSMPIAVVSGAPVTMACWYYRTSSATSQAYVSVCNTTSTNLLSLTHGSNNFISALANDGVTGAQTQVYPDSSINTWNHGCAVFNSNSSRRVFWNGINSGITTTASNVSSLNVTVVGGRYSAGVVGQYSNGNIAEVGIWNISLTDEEIASLAKGITCDKIRPQNLVFYAPLIRDLQDTKGGLTITNNNGAAITDHPRIYK
jgi:hypothetical protein